MIVRISTEAQYKLSDDALEQVNALDNQAVRDVDAGDEAAFRATFTKLLDLVRAQGTVLEDDDLHTSDVILPPADISLAEAAEEFTGDGLIPG